ncbi:hypothetical protein EBZ37_08945 [bacterium]|nr:hypothetical protein [bacterium]
MHPLRLVVAFLIFLSACSSPIKRADKLMESGNFQEAIEILEEASITNRNDRDILEKLKEAKTKLVQRKFIEVRLARMAGNSEGALDLLTETLEKREKWGSSIKQQSGAVQVTIQEESEYARPVLRRRIEKLAESELPWPTYKERLQHRIEAQGQSLQGAIDTLVPHQRTRLDLL